MSTNDREQIFARIREALAPLPTRTEKPEWEDSLIVCRTDTEYLDLKAHFAAKLNAASGVFLDTMDGLERYLKDNGSTFGYCDPTLAETFAGLDGMTFETDLDRGKINDYSFGITRATCAIAESGSILLRDQDTTTRLGALAPWIHVAVIREQDIVATIGEAIAQFGDDPSCLILTGPSKTADVEGILIEGVHGPGIQIGFVLPN